MSDSEVTVYYSSISSSMETKKHQKSIFDILESKKIKFQILDVSKDDNLSKMRQQMGDEKGLAPQLFRGEQYLGGYEAFEEANEDKKLDSFLQISS